MITGPSSAGLEVFLRALLMSKGISRACVSHTYTAMVASRQAHEKPSQSLNKISLDLGLESPHKGFRVSGSFRQDVLQRSARSLIDASIRRESWVPAPDNTE